MQTQLCNCEPRQSINLPCMYILASKEAADAAGKHFHVTTCKTSSEFIHDRYVVCSFFVEIALKADAE